MIFISFLDEHPVLPAGAAGLVVAPGIVAPGGVAEGAVETGPGGGPAEGALARFYKDTAHGFFIHP